MWIAGWLGPDDYAALLELVCRERRDQHLHAYPKTKAGEGPDPKMDPELKKQ